MPDRRASDIVSTRENATLRASAPVRVAVTYIGGPTALLEVAGVRLLTDPTFDPAGQEYDLGKYKLRKRKGPAISEQAAGHVDAVLLSHDHHFDNLDEAGRKLLLGIPQVISTRAAAERLKAAVVGLDAWQSTEIHSKCGHSLRVTATPARHGPSGGDRGPVIGFILALPGSPGRHVYISGDTVWFEGIAEVGSRFRLQAALLFMGAARIAAAGTSHLTLTAAEGVRAARAFGEAAIIPLHYEGWDHYSESRADIERAFEQAGVEERLLWLEAGKRTVLGE